MATFQSTIQNGRNKTIESANMTIDKEGGGEEDSLLHEGGSKDNLNQSTKKVKFDENAKDG